MVNIQICRKCPHCTYLPHKTSKDGVLVRVPMIDCQIANEILLMNSTPPNDCPYVLEHVMTMQDAEQELVDSLSAK